MLLIVWLVYIPSDHVLDCCNCCVLPDLSNYFGEKNRNDGLTYKNKAQFVKKKQMELSFNVSPVLTFSFSKNNLSPKESAADEAEETRKCG